MRWFVALAEIENVTAAAARLNVTQPTLTRALQRLENEVGAPLFDRTGRRLRLNEYGKIFLERSRESLQSLDRATKEIDALRNPESGIIRLAVLHSMAVWFAPEIIRRYRSIAPKARYELQLAAAHEMVGHLRSGRVDLAITGPRPDADDLGWHVLRVEPLTMAVPANHPLAARETISVADAAGEPLVTLRSHFAMRHLIDALYDAHGLHPVVALETMEIPSIEGLVAAGLGVGIVPRPREGAPRPEVAYVPLTDDGAERPIGLAWRKGEMQNPAVKRFAEFVRSRMGQLT